MDNDFTLPEAADDLDRKLLSDIEKYGWHIVFVAEEEDSPRFAFTVGLYYSFSHPEILVVGLKQEVAHSLLKSIVTRIEAGAKFEEGELISDIATFPLTFVPVELDNYRDYLGYAMWFYGSMPAPFPALQLIWPDASGLFPWQEGYDSRFSELQPLLHGDSYQPPE
jgi:Domain of unknown function (DUF4262)